MSYNTFRLAKRLCWNISPVLAVVQGMTPAAPASSRWNLSRPLAALQSMPGVDSIDLGSVETMAPSKLIALFDEFAALGPMSSVAVLDIFFARAARMNRRVLAHISESLSARKFWQASYVYMVKSLQDEVSFHPRARRELCYFLATSFLPDPPSHQILAMSLAANVGWVQPSPDLAVGTNWALRQEEWQVLSALLCLHSVSPATLVTAARAIDDFESLSENRYEARVTIGTCRARLGLHPGQTTSFLFGDPSAQGLTVADLSVNLLATAARPRLSTMDGSLSWFASSPVADQWKSMVLKVWLTHTPPSLLGDVLSHVADLPGLRDSSSLPAFFASPPFARQARRRPVRDALVRLTALASSPVRLAAAAALVGP